MKKFMSIFFAGIICFGFMGSLAGCKEKVSSHSVKTEKIIPQEEKIILPAPVAPVERQSQGE